jgi:hypothetical protein
LTTALAEEAVLSPTGKAKSEATALLARDSDMASRWSLILSWPIGSNALLGFCSPLDN